MAHHTLREKIGARVVADSYPIARLSLSSLLSLPTQYKYNLYIHIGCLRYPNMLALDQ